MVHALAREPQRRESSCYVFHATQLGIPFRPLVFLKSAPLSMARDNFRIFPPEYASFEF
jgi:hypothetical protein